MSSHMHQVENAVTQSAYHLAGGNQGILDPNMLDSAEHHVLTPQIALDGLRSLATGMRQDRKPNFFDTGFADAAFAVFDVNGAMVEADMRGPSNFAARIAATVGDLAIAARRGTAPRFALPYLREQTYQQLESAGEFSLAAKQSAMVLAHSRIDGMGRLLAEAPAWSKRLARANRRLNHAGTDKIVIPTSALATKHSARNAFLGLAISSIDELSGTLE